MKPVHTQSKNSENIHLSVTFIQRMSTACELQSVGNIFEPV